LKYSLWIILAAVIIFIAVLLGTTHIGRYVFWNYADIDDYLKFPQVTIHKGNDPFLFEKSSIVSYPELPEQFRSSPDDKDLDRFLEDHETVAFVIIQDDTVKYQNFFDGYSEESILMSFSISKSLISALIGIAIQSGQIKSVDQPVTDFLSGFKHEGFDNITIRNLLEMRSGIDFSENYVNPLSDVAKFYYGKNILKYTYNLDIADPPGEKYEYVSCNSQLLVLILENATGKTLPAYLEEKIWKVTDMEYDASWNVDSEEHGTIKAFCCLNARVYDFARFGKLYLDKGKWNGVEIVPEGWIQESLLIKNDSRDDDGYPYGYNWRILENGSFFAKGIMGQYIYVNPSKRMLILRFGHSYAGLDWVPLFEELSEQY